MESIKIKLIYQLYDIEEYWAIFYIFMELDNFMNDEPKKSLRQHFYILFPTIFLGTIKRNAIILIVMHKKLLKQCFGIF